MIVARAVSAVMVLAGCVRSAGRGEGAGPTHSRTRAHNKASWSAFARQAGSKLPRGDAEVRSGESDAVLAMIRARTEAPVDFTHERYQDCRDMLQVIRMATGRPGATASDNNGEEITIPHDRAPLRLRHLGGRHG